eukprot:16427201-Heterocapsa_arctica.AAC.1
MRCSRRSRRRCRMILRAKVRKPRVLRRPGVANAPEVGGGLSRLRDLAVPSGNCRTQLPRW